MRHFKREKTLELLNKTLHFSLQFQTRVCVTIFHRNLERTIQIFYKVKIVVG